MSKSNKIKPGLGKGLGALIGSVTYKPEEGFSLTGEPDKTGFTSLIDLDKIITNPFQPRYDFDEVALEDLKNSILKHGVITAISVRKKDDQYELISGERRVRAARLAGLKQIPAYVLDVNTNTQMLEIALIENLQREDLNPVEIANGYQRLIEEYNYTQEQLADRIGKDRSTITNFLRILKLPASVQDLIRAKKISFGHGRALAALDDHTKIIWATNEIISNNLSVRETEKLVKKIIENKFIQNKKSPKTNQMPDDIEAIIKEKTNQLRDIYGTQVKIYPKSKSSGTIELEYYTADDFERIMELLSKAK